MSRHVQLIAVPHQLQGPKFHGYVDDPSYSSWVEGFIGDGVDFVFEEAAGRGPSIAQQLAESILKPGRYLDIDPPLSERQKHGLAERSGGGGPIDPSRSPDVYEYSDVNEQRKREDLWQKRIQVQNFQKGLVICGIAHSLSLGFRLQAAGEKLERVYIYIPYSKLCPRKHT